MDIVDSVDPISNAVHSWVSAEVRDLCLPRGFVTLYRVNNNTGIKEILFEDGENLVVNRGRNTLCDQLQGVLSTPTYPMTPTTWATLVEAQQSTIGRALIGDGGHDTTPGPTWGQPLSPIVTDSSLASFLYELPIDSVTRPTETSCAFQFSIPEDQHNVPFSEIGLGVRGNPFSPPDWNPTGNVTHRLFSRKCLGYITKVAGWSYSFTWVVAF